MATYNGTNSSETLNYTNWNYGWNVFYMNGGNDSVHAPSTGTSYSFYGGYGNDYFMGDTGIDIAYGGYDQDNLNGWSGNDVLDGNFGNDHLYGGAGRDHLTGGGDLDHLYGGADSDYLIGGTGTDYFHFYQGESNAISGQADTIADWNVANDYIDSSIAGTASNYREAATSYTSIDNARWQVENTSTLRTGDHVFLYNAQTDTGYLLSDLDRNYSFETGVIIKGAGAASDMNWSDIVL